MHSMIAIYHRRDKLSDLNPTLTVKRAKGPVRPKILVLRTDFGLIYALRRSPAHCKFLAVVRFENLKMVADRATNVEVRG
jgi:hypothetical protein